jgi:hypothetical protein
MLEASTTYSLSGAKDFIDFQGDFTCPSQPGRNVRDALTLSRRSPTVNLDLRGPESPWFGHGLTATSSPARLRVTPIDLYEHLEDN